MKADIQNVFSRFARMAKLKARVYSHHAEFIKSTLTNLICQIWIKLQLVIVLDTGRVFRSKFLHHGSLYENVIDATIKWTCLISKWWYVNTTWSYVAWPLGFPRPWKATYVVNSMSWYVIVDCYVLYNIDNFNSYVKIVGLSIDFLYPLWHEYRNTVKAISVTVEYLIKWRSTKKTIICQVITLYQPVTFFYFWHEILRATAHRLRSKAIMTAWRYIPYDYSYVSDVFPLAFRREVLRQNERATDLRPKRKQHVKKDPCQKTTSEEGPPSEKFPLLSIFVISK